MTSRCLRFFGSALLSILAGRSGRTAAAGDGRLHHIASGLSVFSGELNIAQAAKGEKELRDIQWRALHTAMPLDERA